MSDPIKLSRTNFGELLTPVHRKLFFDSYDAKPKQYVNVFKTETSDKKQETFPHLGAFGTWAENTEGSDFNFDDMAEGRYRYFRCP